MARNWHHWYGSDHFHFGSSSSTTSTDTTTTTDTATTTATPTDTGATSATLVSSSSDTAAATTTTDTTTTTATDTTATDTTATDTTTTTDTSSTASTTTGLSAADQSLINSASVIISADSSGTTDALNAAISQAHAGDVILVRGGTYEGQVNVWQGGTSGAPVTIKAYPGEHPIIDGSGTGANTDLVSITASNVIFQGFEVENASRTGIGVWDASNVQILDNLVHDTTRGGIYAGADQPGIASNITISGNTVHDTVLENQDRSASSGWAQAIGIDLVSDSTVSNNYSFDNYGEGFGALSSSNVTFASNTAYDNYSVDMYFDNSQYIEAHSNTLFETGDTSYYRNGSPAAGMVIANEYTSYQMASLGDNIHDNTFMGVSGPYYDDSYGWGGGLSASTLGAETILPASSVTSDMMWTESLWA